MRVTIDKIVGDVICSEPITDERAIGYLSMRRQGGYPFLLKMDNTTFFIDQGCELNLFMSCLRDLLSCLIYYGYKASGTLELFSKELNRKRTGPNKWTVTIRANKEEHGNLTYGMGASNDNRYDIDYYGLIED